ncbi:MAG: hypothetical protein F6K35_19985 [Okeania sp. SIO2H7]|nr:hypothetical protein [Okeania sp. SIO2H7]
MSIAVSVTIRVADVPTSLVTDAISLMTGDVEISFTVFCVSSAMTFPASLKAFPMSSKNPIVLNSIIPIDNSRGLFLGTSKILYDSII